MLFCRGTTLLVFPLINPESKKTGLHITFVLPTKLPFFRSSKNLNKHPKCSKTKYFDCQKNVGQAAVN